MKRDSMKITCNFVFPDRGNVYPNIALFRNMSRCSYMILPVVLYGCDTWSMTLREEHRLRVFENKVLRRIFGPKREKVTGEWRKLHFEELHDLCSSTNVIRLIKPNDRDVRLSSPYGERRRAFRRFLVGKPEGKRPLGRPRRRLEDDIKTDIE